MMWEWELAESDDFSAGRSSEESSSSSSETYDIDEEETDFEDEDDAAAFQGLTKGQYRTHILPVKDDCADTFSYRDFHEKLSDEGKMRLGSYLAMCERGLRNFDLTLREDLPQLLCLVFQGPFHHEHNLRRFKMEYMPVEPLGGMMMMVPPPGRGRLTPHDWECVSGYLSKAPSLCDLDIRHMRFGEGDLELLASGLTGGSKLQFLTLAYLDIDSTASWGGLFDALKGMNKLRIVKLNHCNVGDEVCQGLAGLLRNRETDLEMINLGCNAIDNRGVRTLCEALSDNTSLKTLHLHDNPRITGKESWAEIEKLVFDNSSLERLHSSNHTIRGVFGLPNEGQTPRLRKVFPINQRSFSSRPKWHQKLFHAIWADRGNEFDIGPFVHYDVKLMPFVLQFFGSSAWHRRYKIDCIFELTRQWNVAELFGFPSPEKARLSARINVLERETHDLRDEVKMLKQEVARLSSERRSELHPGKRARTGDD